MKNIQYSIGLLLLLALVACGGGVTSDQDASEGAVRTLTVGETQTSFISVEGEVDTYRLRAAETNRFLHIHCEERTSGSNVDLLVTVFEEVNGNRVRVFGKHKPDGASIGADLDLWIFIDTPKDLFITVRDLLDDDASVSIPYFLTATFEDSAEGNHNFSNAQSLTIGAAETTSDVIEEIGEVDCFTFAPTASGVYAVNVDHHKPAGGSPVQLAVSLYDENGNRIQRITDPYHVIRAYLTPESGPYFLIVEDSDSMDSDLGAPYDIAIEPIVVSEAQDNDVVEDATALELDAEDIYTAAGTIDYGCSSISPGHEGDQDWYRFDLGQVGGATTYHQVLMTVDGGETITGTTPFRVIVYNAEMTLVTSHDFAIRRSGLPESVQGSQRPIHRCSGRRQSPAVGQRHQLPRPSGGVRLKRCHRDHRRQHGQQRYCIGGRGFHRGFRQLSLGRGLVQPLGRYDQRQNSLR
jgi:hypothetical protein